VRLSFSLSLFPFDQRAINPSIFNFNLHLDSFLSIIQSHLIVRVQKVGKPLITLHVFSKLATHCNEIVDVIKSKDDLRVKYLVINDKDIEKYL